MALIEQAHEVYDQLLHPFHAAAYPVSGERFKVRRAARPIAGHAIVLLTNALLPGPGGVVRIEHTGSGPSQVSVKPPGSERHNQL